MSLKLSKRSVFKNEQANTKEGEAFWQEHINRHLESDLSKAAYSKRHKLNYDRFLYWYRKITKNQSRNKLLPIKLNPIETSKRLCSFNVGDYELQIYDLSVVEHLLNRIN